MRDHVEYVAENWRQNFYYSKFLKTNNWIDGGKQRRWLAVDLRIEICTMWPLKVFACLCICVCNHPRDQNRLGKPLRHTLTLNWVIEYFSFYCPYRHAEEERKRLTVSCILIARVKMRIPNNQMLLRILKCTYNFVCRIWRRRGLAFHHLWLEPWWICWICILLALQ